MVAPPREIDNVDCQTRSYDATSTFAQTSAETAAASRTTALPVSVRRKPRSGVSRFRTQAVRPANGDSVVVMPPSSQSDRGWSATESGGERRRRAQRAREALDQLHDLGVLRGLPFVDEVADLVAPGLRHLL